MKKTNYFSHDSNARNDSKIIALRIKHGLEGYAIYFMIIERLREETDYVCKREYEEFAFDFRSTQEIVKSVIEDFDLFILTENNTFYSESLQQRMLIKDEKAKKHSLGGKKGMANRYGKTESNLTNLDKKDNLVITNLDKNLTSKVKESKVKESKVKESKVNILNKEGENSNFENFQEIEIIEPEEETPFTDDFEQRIRAYKNYAINTSHYENVQRAFKKTKEEMLKLLDEFIQENIDSRQHSNLKDDLLFNKLDTHFYNWVKIKKNKQTPKQTNFQILADKVLSSPNINGF